MNNPDAIQLAAEYWDEIITLNQKLLACQTERGNLQAELFAAQQETNRIDRIATELQVTCDKQSKRIAYLLDRMKLIIGEPINAEFIAEQALNEFLGE